MLLSIIIVNYNSKLLLKQCLHSLEKATECIDSEIIVVDNNSTDGSGEYLPQKFPAVKFVFNKENVGFAKACNQGYKISSGDYVLFLNPDTIIPGNCLQECISFFQTHADAGAAGVRMINGHRNFLKESKRGFPSPATSFFKLFGFVSLFPRSGIFARYYLGHMPEKENNPVDVLSGAFMMLRRDVMEVTGGFDEIFFMYGEDVDLSYRIQQAGYVNYYLGKITIIHFKGSSTRHDAERIKNFYGAMRLFVKKHYENKKPGWQVSLLYAGISIRKMLSIAGLLFR